MKDHLYLLLCAATLAGCSLAARPEDGGTADDGGAQNQCGVQAVEIVLNVESGEILELAPTSSPGDLLDPGDLEIRSESGEVLSTAVIPAPTLNTGLGPNEDDPPFVEEGILARIRMAWPMDAVSVNWRGSEKFLHACDARALKDANGSARLKILWRSGPIAERINMVILGDGYTEAEQGDFEAAAQLVSVGFLGTEPWRSYQSFLNIWYVPLISAHSGLSDGGPADTALRCHLAKVSNLPDLRSVPRCDEKAIFSVASAALRQAPHLRLVLVNGQGYGINYGGVYAVLPDERPYLPKVALHELGHQTGLRDEYDFELEDNPNDRRELINCSRHADSTPWEEWRDLPELGAFPVCGYRKWYRPKEECLMGSHFAPSDFCEVCRDHLVRWIYQNIGKTVRRKSPPERNVEIKDGGLVRFSADVVAPTEDTLSYAWKIGAELISEEGPNLTLDWCEAADLSLEVDDGTDWVRIGRPDILKRQTDWLLTCGTPLPRLLFEEYGIVKANTYSYHDPPPNTPFMSVEKGQRLIVRVEGNYDVDLYIALDRYPTNNDFDMASFARGDDLIRYVAPRKGKLRIGVHGYNTDSEYHLTVETDPQE